MQYIKLRYQTDEVDLFSDEDMDGNVQPISREDYERLLAYLQKKNPAAILPIQIAYYAGLRIGEACGLAWQDVNLEEDVYKRQEFNQTIVMITHNNEIAQLADRIVRIEDGKIVG